MSTQLHQVLAAEKSSINTSKAILEETARLFRAAKTHFDGMEVKTTTNFETDGAKDEVEATHPITSVESRVAYTMQALEDPLDIVLTKDETNSGGKAKAELKVGEHSFGEFSAIALISLGKYLSELRKVLLEAPTMDQHEHSWTPNDEIFKGCYESERISKIRTKTRDKAVKVPGFPDDPKSPVYTVKEDYHYGDIVTRHFTGRWTSVRKHQVLERLSQMIDAVRKATGEANKTEIANIKKAREVFGFILNK